MKIQWRVLLSATRDAWPFWLTLCGLIFAFVLGGQFSDKTSTTIRYAGTVLQVLGVATVAMGLSLLRKRFGLRPISENIFEFLKQILEAFITPKPISLEVADAYHLHDVVIPKLYEAVASDASLEERVLQLEKNFVLICKELETTDQKLRKELGVVRSEIERENNERKAQNKQIMGTIKEVAIGGIHLEIVGVLWLVFAAFCSSIPDEITALYCWFFRITC